MSNYNFLRIAGISGMLAAACMIGYTFTIDPATSTPNSPLFSVFLWASILAGIVFTMGLYQFYNQEAATLSMVAAGVSLLGYVLFAITAFGPFNPDNILVRIADILVYVVGVPLFSWLAYTSHKGSRPLAIVGFLVGLAGVGVYALTFGAGVESTDTTHPLIGVLYGLYFAYLILVIVWLFWTGFVLSVRKPQMAMA
jgi:hypothetical protein